MKDWIHPTLDERLISLALRLMVLAYGIFCYAVFLGTFLYAIGFIGNFIVPKSIDTGPASSLGEALVVNGLLLALFAVQHSVMARPAFKRWWARLIPAQVERSTYVLLSSLCLVLLFWQWRPLTSVVWEIRHPVGASAAWIVFAAGWLIVLASTFLIDHFDLFGLRQVFAVALGRGYSPPRFHTPALYRVVRHPIMLGFLIAFWATPVMSAGHLFFAFATTGYIIVGVQLEERDLRATFADTYDEYRQQVPMFMPWKRK